MGPFPPRRRRARPVADAPIEPLLARAEDLAKGWLLTLLEQVPLDDAPGILAADLARDGPRVCTAVVRALAHDEDLRRIESGGALDSLVGRAGQFAGAIGPESASRAIDALHAVVWSGVRNELSDPEPEQIYELAERLMLVIEFVRSAALRRAESDAAAEPDSVSELDVEQAGPTLQPRRLASVAPARTVEPSAAGAPLEPLWMRGARGRDPPV